MISIAIDGPSGVGKSTLAKAIAKKLNLVYVDTGALYRAIGLMVLKQNKNPNDEQDVVSVLKNVPLSLVNKEGEQYVYLDGEDVTQAIRDEKVSMAASGVSAMPQVRAFLLKMQQNFALNDNVIMDGRDIGTVVLPNATVKIFLTASVQVRAQRRYNQLVEAGSEVSLETVTKDVEQRDYNDTHRKIAPLKPADDAIIVDTSNNSFEESMQILLSIIEKYAEI